jgi:hypothetical protein
MSPSLDQFAALKLETATVGVYLAVGAAHRSRAGRSMTRQSWRRSFTAWDWVDWEFRETPREVSMGSV